MSFALDTPLLAFDEYRSLFLKKYPPWPQNVNLGINSRCALRCIMCHQSLKGRSPKAVVSERVWAEMLKVVSRASEVTISGSGEPLLHPDFINIVRTIASIGPPITMYSSLNSWKRGYAEAIVESVSQFTCSMDAATEGTYARIRVGGDFCRVKKHVQEIIEYRRSIGYSRKEIEISLGFMPMDANFHEMLKAAELAAELGMDALMIQPLFEITKIEQSSTRPEKLAELRRQIPLVIERCRQLRISFRNTMPYVEDESMKMDRPKWIELGAEKNPGESMESFAWHPPEGKPSILECSNSHRQTMLCSDGNVLPCFKKFYPMGNLNYEDFEQIWEGSGLAEYRRRMMTAGVSPCRGCTCEKWIEEPNLRSLLPSIHPEDMTHLCRIVGWWDLERDGFNRFYRWTNRQASIFLPNLGPNSIIELRGYVNAQSFRAFGDAPLEMKIYPDFTMQWAPQEGEFQINIPVPEISSPFLRLDMICPATFNPKKDYGEARDYRDLGFMFFGAAISEKPSPSDQKPALPMPAEI